MLYWQEQNVLYGPRYSWLVGTRYIVSARCQTAYTMVSGIQVYSIETKHVVSP